MSVSIPSEPITRKEQYLAKIAGQDVEIPSKPLTREEAYLDAIAKGGSGGGGTNDYNDLLNQPKINDTTLEGDMSAEDLGLATEQALSGKQDALTAGDYIQFDGDEISVNRSIAVNSVRRYVFRGSESTRYIDTYLDDELVSTVSMYYAESTRNFNDEISVGYDGSTKWLITNLKASTTKPQGYVEQRGFYDSSEYTQSFEIELHAGDKLIIKDELDAAIAGASGLKRYIETREAVAGSSWSHQFAHRPKVVLLIADLSNGTPYYLATPIVIADDGSIPFPYAMVCNGSKQFNPISGLSYNVNTETLSYSAGDYDASFNRGTNTIVYLA